MTFLLPSEIHRLVLGFLRDEAKCPDSAGKFLEESTALAEVATLTRAKRPVTLKVAGKSLSDLLEEHSDLNAEIDDLFSNVIAASGSEGEKGAPHRTDSALRKLKHLGSCLRQLQQQNPSDPLGPRDPTLPSPSTSSRSAASSVKPLRKLSQQSHRSRSQFRELRLRKEKEEAETAQTAKRIQQELTRKEPLPAATAASGKTTSTTASPAAAANGKVTKERTPTMPSLSPHPASPASIPVAATAATLPSLSSSPPLATTSSYSHQLNTPMKSRKSALKARVPKRHSAESPWHFGGGGIGGGGGGGGFGGDGGFGDAEKVKKKLGAFTQSANDEELNVAFGEPLANMLSGTEFSEVESTVQNFLTNDDYISNLLSMLDEVETLEVGTSETNPKDVCGNAVVTAAGVGHGAATASGQRLVMNVMDDKRVAEASGPSLQAEVPIINAPLEKNIISSLTPSPIFTLQPPYMPAMSPSSGHLSTPTIHLHEQDDTSTTVAASPANDENRPPSLIEQLHKPVTSPRPPEQPASLPQVSTTSRNQTDEDQLSPDLMSTDQGDPQTPEDADEALVIVASSPEKMDRSPAPPRLLLDKDGPSSSSNSSRKRRHSPDFSHLKEARKLRLAESLQQRQRPPPRLPQMTRGTRSVIKKLMAQRTRKSFSNLRVSMAAVVAREFSSNAMDVVPSVPGTISKNPSSVFAAVARRIRDESNSTATVLYHGETVSVSLPGGEDLAVLTEAGVVLNLKEFLEQNNCVIIDDPTSEIQSQIDDAGCPGEEGAFVDNRIRVSVVDAASAAAAAGPQPSEDPASPVRRRHILCAVTPSKPSSSSDHRSPRHFLTPVKLTPMRMSSLGSLVATDSTPVKTTSPLKGHSFATPKVARSLELIPSTFINLRTPTSQLKVIGGASASSPQNSLTTPVLHDLAHHHHQTPIKPLAEEEEPAGAQYFTPTTSPVRGRGALLDTPGLRYLQEEGERLSSQSEASCSEDSMSPSRFHRRKGLKSKSRKNMLLTMEGLGLGGFDSKKKKPSTPFFFTKEADEDDVLSGAESVVGGVPRTPGKTPGKSPSKLVLVMSPKSSPVVAKRALSLNSPLKKNVEETLRPSTSSFAVDPDAHLFKTPMKTPRKSAAAAAKPLGMSIGNDPLGKVKRRVSLVQVVQRSPLRNPLQSNWEARHDVNNLDNYRASSATSAKQQQVQDSRRRHVSSLSPPAAAATSSKKACIVTPQKKESSRASSLPSPTAVSQGGQSSKGSKFASKAKLNINMELVPQMKSQPTTILRNRQEKRRHEGGLGRGTTREASDHEICTALGLVRKASGVVPLPPSAGGGARKAQKMEEEGSRKSSRMRTLDVKEKKTAKKAGGVFCKVGPCNKSVVWYSGPDDGEGVRLDTGKTVTFFSLPPLRDGQKNIGKFDLHL